MDAFAKFFIALLSTGLIVSFTGNLLIFACIWRQMKSTGTISAMDVFVLNLALSDMVFGGFVLPQQVHDVSHSGDFYEAEVLCKIVNAMPVVCITTNIYTMVAMSVERYRRVVLQSMRVLRWRQASMVTIVVWLYALTVAMPTAVAYTVKTDQLNASEPVCESKMSATFNLLNSQVILWLCYALPQVAFYANYGRLVAFLWRRSRRRGRVVPAPQMFVDAAANKDHPRGGGGGGGSVGEGDGGGGGGGTWFLPEAVTRKTFNVVKMLLLLVMLFLVSWLPYFTLETFASVTGEATSRFTDGYINMTKLFVETCSVSFNFPLYLRYNISFRKAFRDLFHLGRKVTNSVDPASGDRSHLYSADRPKNRVTVAVIPTVS